MNLQVYIIGIIRSIISLTFLLGLIFSQNFVWAYSPEYYSSINAPMFDNQNSGIPHAEIQNRGLNSYNERLSSGPNSISPQSGGSQFSRIPTAAPDRFIVKYKNSVQQNFNEQDIPHDLVASLPSGISGEIHQKSLGMNGLQVIQVPSASLDSTLTVFKNNPLIEYTEPDYQITVEPSQTGIQIFTPSLMSSTIKPNDPEYPKLWGLHNTGQTPFNGTSGADISAEEAWAVTTGSHDIVVAVLDSGVDYSHPDLAENIWTNEKEIPDNGIDDDGNGYIDDVHGWNFQGKNNTPIDENGHGTHCAGIIGAVGNNNIGVTGVNWHVRLMPLRFMDSTGNGYISDAVSAIQYANQMGADVISCSWSGNENSQALKDAMAASKAVIVCASGNGGSNDDTTPLYPATFTGSNIITVAASDSNDNLASFSNYGVSSVNIAAPGVEIASTYPGNKYAYMSGTSMATPYVAGVAALLKSIKPTLSNSQIKDAILSSADSIPNLTGKISTGGRLNAYRTLTGITDSSTRTKDNTNDYEKNGISSQIDTSPVSHTLILTQPSELNGQTSARISGVSQFSNSPPKYPYS